MNKEVINIRPHYKRVSVLILGGGIHGVGVLHDLASRGITDIHLIERSFLASGTSSRSTKLVHGGLRYLKKLSQIPLVSESLRERNLLVQVAPDIVRPIELIYPVQRDKPFRLLSTKAGLTLYDALSGSLTVGKHAVVGPGEAKKKLPILDNYDRYKFFSFWDCQADDLALVRRVADSAVFLGASYSEGTSVVNIARGNNAWRVSVVSDERGKQEIEADVVVNCLGPWADVVLKTCDSLSPKVSALKNKGSHLLVGDLGLSLGLFLRSPIDGRVVFILPWQGFTLIGTTEQNYSGDPDCVRITEAEVEYLLGSCNYYLKSKISKSDIRSTFSGLRWLAFKGGTSISSISREAVISEHCNGDSLLLTLYGGKLTGYRSLSERIGNRVVKHLGINSSSQTCNREMWLKSSSLEESFSDIIKRFSSLER